MKQAAFALEEHPGSPEQGDGSLKAPVFAEGEDGSVPTSAGTSAGSNGNSLENTFNSEQGFSFGTSHEATGQIAAAPVATSGKAPIKVNLEVRKPKPVLARSFSNSSGQRQPSTPKSPLRRRGEDDQSGELEFSFGAGGLRLPDKNQLQQLLSGSVDHGPSQQKAFPPMPGVPSSPEDSSRQGLATVMECSEPTPTPPRTPPRDHIPPPPPPVAVPSHQFPWSPPSPPSPSELRRPPSAPPPVAQAYPQAAEGVLALTGQAMAGGLPLPYGFQTEEQQLQLYQMINYQQQEQLQQMVNYQQQVQAAQQQQLYAASQGGFVDAEYGAYDPSLEYDASLEHQASLDNQAAVKAAREAREREMPLAYHLHKHLATFTCTCESGTVKVAAALGCILILLVGAAVVIAILLKGH